MWELQRDDGGFSPFPPQDSAIIEADYSVNSRFCNVSGHGKLDFRRMVLVQKGSRELTSTSERLAGYSRLARIPPYVPVQFEVLVERYGEKTTSATQD